VGWVALNAAGVAAACLLWRERRESPAARGALLLVALAAVLHLAWLGAFLLLAPNPGPQLWLVLVLLLALDLVTAALACTAWNASRASGVLLFVVLAGLLGGTALALGDTALATTGL
jgi:tryptophan-rich sensory protein